MRNKRSTTGNDRALAQAQQGSIYGRFVDVGAAFNQGLMIATKAGTVPTTNPVGSVKNNYEIKLEKYLNNLPPNMDLAAIPEVYRGDIQEFLMNQKLNYVDLGNQLMDYEVGTTDYLEIQNQMSGISNSMKNLKNQFDIYGANKKELTKDINENRTSLSIENQANINLLRGVYNEEYSLNIDGFGNISFVGDDGERKLSELPGYENKAFGIATGMEKLANDAYDNGYSKGIVISNGDANFNRNKKNLKNQIQKGGRNSLMSVIHDGIVADTPMIDNPMIAENLRRYYEGSLSYEGLTNLVVDTYMDAVVENSAQGKAARKNVVGSDYKNPKPEFGLRPDKINLKDGMYYSYPSSLGNEPKLVRIPGTGITGNTGNDNPANSNNPADLQKKIDENIEKLKKEFPGMTKEYYEKNAKKMLLK